MRIRSVYIIGIMFCTQLLFAQNDDWVNEFEQKLIVPNFKTDTFNIIEFGGIPTDLQKNNEALRKAIDACHSNGGGVVHIPSGDWKVGPIHLKSNVNLYVAKNAKLSFSKNVEDYLPLVLIQRGGYFCYNYSPPIYAYECTNIAITGKGTVDGNGHVWWPWKKNQPGMVALFEMGKSGVPIEKRKFGKPEFGVRPPFVQFIKSINVYIDGPTFIDGPSWMIHPVQCENVIIRNIAISSHGPNNDGIDPDMCKNVLIENCLIDAGDDNIAIKSGRDEEAWRIGKPSENIIVRNCKSLRGHGGIVIGSEVSAGVKNVLVENCNFNETDNGIRMKTKLGRGGVVENIIIRDITIEKVRKNAIILNMQYDAEPIEREMEYSKSASSVPVFRNILIERVECKSATAAIKLLGLGHETLSDITIRESDIQAHKGIEIDRAGKVELEGLKLEISSDKMVKITGSRDIELKSRNFPSNNSSSWLQIHKSESIKINGKEF